MALERNIDDVTYRAARLMTSNDPVSDVMRRRADVKLNYRCVKPCQPRFYTANTLNGEIEYIAEHLVWGVPALVRERPNPAAA